MVEIAFSSSFKKSFSKRIKGNKRIEEKFWDSIKLFMKEPFHEKLKTHKLSGKLQGLWSFSVEWDIRIIFYFADKNKVILIDIGKHEEVY